RRPGHPQWSADPGAEGLDLRTGASYAARPPDGRTAQQGPARRPGLVVADRPGPRRPGHAVAVALEGDGLVLIDRGRGADHAGVEPVAGQRHRRREILGEAVPDGERAEERLHDPLTLGLAALTKEDVQFIKIGDAGHRGGEPALHGLDGPLGVGLLVTAG